MLGPLAKTWTEKFQNEISQSPDVGRKIETYDKKISLLEKQARQLIRMYGCTDPKSRSIYRGMADTLINWCTFKDTFTA